MQNKGLVENCLVTIITEPDSVEWLERVFGSKIFFRKTI